MTTLRKMRETILRKKLAIFFMQNLKKLRKRERWGLWFEHINPNVVGRCISLKNIHTKQCVGYDILVSAYHLRHYPNNLEAYKKIILHEMAHTHKSARGILRPRVARGHDMVFRKTARRFGCGRDFSQQYCYRSTGGDI